MKWYAKSQAHESLRLDWDQIRHCNNLLQGCVGVCVLNFNFNFTYSDGWHPQMCFNWCAMLNWVITHDADYDPQWWLSLYCQSDRQLKWLATATWRWAATIFIWHILFLNMFFILTYVSIFLSPLFGSIQWGFSRRLLCRGERGVGCLQQMGEYFPSFKCTLPCMFVPMLVENAIINIIIWVKAPPFSLF